MIADAASFPYLKPLLLRPSIRHNNVNFHRNCSIIATKMENGTSKKVETLSGGALVVLEGLDRSGKSSQCSELLSHLKFLGYPVELWRYPDRNTAFGEMISAYLSNQSNLDDHTIHLLFSANRWEKRHQRWDCWLLTWSYTLIYHQRKLLKEVAMVMRDMSVLTSRGRSEKNIRLFMMLHGRLLMPACQWKKSRRCSENMCLSVSQNAKMERLSLTFGYISPDCLLDFVQVLCFLLACWESINLLPQPRKEWSL